MFPGFSRREKEEFEQRRMLEKISKLLSDDQTDSTKKSSVSAAQSTGLRMQASPLSAMGRPATAFSGVLSTSDKSSESHQNLADQLKAKQSLCDHYEKVASSVPCTYSTDGERHHPQPWFECHTCWGGESNFGSCFPCALKCHKGHQLIAHPKLTSNFYCDCGKNNHQPDVCSQYSAGDEVCLMSSYKCSTCFRRRDSQDGFCCYQCIKNCHRGHDISFIGSVVGRCLCGNPRYTASKCQIARPKFQPWD